MTKKTEDQADAIEPVDVAEEPTEAVEVEAEAAPEADNTPVDPRDAKFDEAGVDAVREHLAVGRYADNRAERAKAWLARQ